MLINIYIFDLQLDYIYENLRFNRTAEFIENLLLKTHFYIILI